MHALNLSVKPLPFCTSNPFASPLFLPAKNITNDLFPLCSPFVISYLELQLTDITHSCAVVTPTNHIINYNRTPSIKECLVLPPLHGEDRSVQLLSCVHHVWAKAKKIGQRLSKFKTQQQWDNGDTRVRFTASPSTRNCEADVPSCPWDFFLSDIKLVLGAPCWMDLLQKVSPLGFQ